MPPNVTTLFSDRHTILDQLDDGRSGDRRGADPGARAPRLVAREDLKLMKHGAVIIDVAIDQGGCFETTRPTTHGEPTYIDRGRRALLRHEHAGRGRPHQHLRAVQRDPAVRTTDRSARSRRRGSGGSRADDGRERTPPSDYTHCRRGDLRPRIRAISALICPITRGGQSIAGSGGWQADPSQRDRECWRCVAPIAESSAASGRVLARTVLAFFAKTRHMVSRRAMSAQGRRGKKNGSKTSDTPEKSRSGPDAGALSAPPPKGTSSSPAGTGSERASPVPSRPSLLEASIPPSRATSSAPETAEIDSEWAGDAEQDGSSPLISPVMPKNPTVPADMRPKERRAESGSSEPALPRPELAEPSRASSPATATPSASVPPSSASVPPSSASVPPSSASVPPSSASVPPSSAGDAEALTARPGSLPPVSERAPQSSPGRTPVPRASVTPLSVRAARAAQSARPPEVASREAGSTSGAPPAVIPSAAPPNVTVSSRPPVDHAARIGIPCLRSPHR